MKDQHTNPLTFLSTAIVFVDSYAAAKGVMERNPDVKEFFIIADNSRRAEPEVAATASARNAKIFRIRPSGSWNQLFKAIADVETARGMGEYGDCKDLMFISLLSAHDISSALRRQRAVNQLSCREMYFLDTLKYGEEQDDAIELALRCMPSVPAPILYQNLSIQQRFDLSGFEFCRFTRPVHCVHSVTNMHDAIPFYTARDFGDTYAEAGQPITAKLAVSA